MDIIAKKSGRGSGSKKRILDAAEKLFLANGFSATSVEKICEASGLTKGSFFHYFESKEDLGKELLRRFCEEGENRRLEWAATQPADPLKRVYGSIDFAVKATRCCAGKGCLLGTLAQELSLKYPEIRDLCEKGFSNWAADLEKDLREAKSRYAPKDDFDPKYLAEHFIAVLEGAQILSKAKRDNRVIERSLEHYRRYMQGLFEKGRNK